MTPKNNYSTKDKKLLILKIVGAFLSIYLLVNLFIYVIGRINHFTFWVSLIVVWLLSWKVVPSLRKKIENS
jgi:hypothetical protein